MAENQDRRDSRELPAKGADEGFVVGGDLSGGGPAVPRDLPEDATMSYIPESVPATWNPPEEGIPGGTLTLMRWGVRAEDSPTEEKPPEQDLAIVGPRFHLDRLVGRGGMGEVWQARQLSLGRIVAVKRVRPDRALDDEEERLQVMSFHQEAIVTAALEHPNIIPVHDLGVDEAGKPLLAMKLVRGRPWNEILAADLRELEMADFLGKHIPILIDVAEAVAFAHAQGIVHRDLKPSQVMVGDFGEVLLVDWGLALDYRREDAARPPCPVTMDELRLMIPSRSSATSPSGTPAYMAPEQTEAQADGVGPWTDVYLLGGTLYYLLTGTPPHQAATSEGAFLRARAGQVEPPDQRSGTSDLPEELTALAMRALAPRPEHRVPNAMAFVEGLKDYLSGAGKRRESQALAQRVRVELKNGPRDYSVFNQALADLDRAAALWPTNPALSGLRAQGLVAFARAALRMGDLVLAEVQARRLLDGPEREDLLGEISACRARGRRRERQRRAALAVIGLLLIVVLGAIVLVQRTQAEKQLAIERALLAQEREGQATRTAELLERINELNRREEALAEEISAVLTVPTRIEAEARPEEKRLNEQQAGELLARRDELRLLRRELESSPAIGERLAPEPFPLLLAEANLAMSKATNTQGFLDAYGLYEQAHRLRPDLPGPLTGMGVATARAGDLTSATVLLARATEATERTHGSRHKEFAEALALEGEANRLLDTTNQNYLEFYRRSLSVLEPQVLETTLALADRYSSLGEWDKALAATSQTLQLVRDMGMDEDFLGARVLDELGSLYMSMGYYDRAVEAGRQSIEVMEASGNEGNMHYGYMKLSLSSSLILAGNLDEGERLMREALEVIEDHPEVSERDLGVAYFSVGNQLLNVGSSDRETPERYLRKAVASYEKSLGERHPKTGKAYSLLGSSLSYQEKYVEAEEMFLKSLNITEERYGPDHFYTGIIHNNLASNSIGMEDIEKAILHQIQSVRILRLWWRPDDPSFGVLYNNVAYTLMKAGRMGEARTMFVAATRHLLRVVGPAHPNTVRLVANLYDDFLLDRLREGDSSEAETSILLGGWLLDWELGKQEFSPQYMRVKTLGRYAHLTSATLALDPPRPDWAEGVVLQSLVLAEMVSLPPDSREYRELMQLAGHLGATDKALGLTKEAAALRGEAYPPADRESDFQKEDYLRTLERVGARFDLLRVADYEEWGPGALDPRGEELDQAIADVIEALTGE